MSIRVSQLGPEVWISRSGHNRVTQLGVEAWTNLTTYVVITGPTGDTTGPTGTPPPEPVQCDVCADSLVFPNVPPWLYNFSQITR